jgi:MFS family permease
MSTTPPVISRSLILVVLAVAGTTFALLQAVVVPALPDIQHALGTTPDGAAWILTANLLSTAVLTPILGRAGDILGKDRVLTAVMAAIGAGTLICAVAPSLPVMLLGRAIQGAGGAVYPVAFGIVRDEFPPERIAGSIGLISSLLGIGAGLGLVVPGVILEHLSYHWLFWLPLAVIVAVTPLIALCVPPSPVRNPAPVNWASAALMATGLAGLLVAVSEATGWGWSSPRTLGLLAGSAAVVGAWVLNELRSPEPLVDMRMMATRAVWTTNVAAVQLVVGPYTGRIERRLGSRAQLQAGMACLVLAYLALVSTHATALELLIATVILGLGLGLGLSSLANLIVSAVRQEQTGVATGMNTVMRTLGGALGGQIVATFIANNVAHGQPTLPGFTASFALQSAFLIMAVIAGLFIPGSTHTRRAPALDRELVRAQEAG